jgi:acyl-CoA synthetase (AMP-forming)/AMP-acid ligase II
VVASAPVSADELLTHCQSQLSSYKCPRRVDFVDELDVDPLGKVRKRELRERYWERTRRQI